MSLCLCGLPGIVSCAIPCDCKHICITSHTPFAHWQPRSDRQHLAVRSLPHRARHCNRGVRVSVRSRQHGPMVQSWFVQRTPNGNATRHRLKSDSRVTCFTVIINACVFQIPLQVMVQGVSYEAYSDTLVVATFGRGIAPSRSSSANMISPLTQACSLSRLPSTRLPSRSSARNLHRATASLPRNLRRQRRGCRSKRIAAHEPIWPTT